MSTAARLTPSHGENNPSQAIEMPEEHWLGSPGSQLRLIVRVEKTSPGIGGLRRHLVRDEDTGALLEWAGPGRYGIRPGDRLKMSGVVHRHETRSNTPVTVLHHCFNPMRLR